MAVGSWRGAEAVFWRISVEISHDDVIGAVAGCGREVAMLPEALAPVALSDVFELLLDLARRAPIGTTHEVTDRYVRRRLQRTRHGFARQNPVDDGHAHLITSLLDDLAHTEPHTTVQHLTPILLRPNEVIAMIRGLVTA